MSERYDLACIRRIKVIRGQAASDGMTTLKQDGLLKVLRGLTDVHEVRRVCIK